MRTAFFDLETTALRADFGQLLCGVIGKYRDDAPEEPILYTYRLVDFSTPEGRCNDKSVAVEIRNVLERFDLIVSYNGIRFDIPFLNTRLMQHGERAFNPLHTRHKDLLYVMRSKFRLSSNSLRNASKHVLGKTVKTELDMKTWREAHAGVTASYNLVIKHCHMDVIELARMWNAIKGISGVLK